MRSRKMRIEDAPYVCTPEPFWHIHHNTLFEWTYEPIERRIEYIQAYKPEHEQATRLRLLKPVRGKLPDTLIQAEAVHGQARAAYNQTRAAFAQAESYVTAQAGVVLDQAWATYGQAKAAYDQACQTCLPAIEALHAQECPECPWDGRTIFP